MSEFTVAENMEKEDTLHIDPFGDAFYVYSELKEDWWTIHTAYICGCKVELAGGMKIHCLHWSVDRPDYTDETTLYVEQPPWYSRPTDWGER